MSERVLHGLWLSMRDAGPSISDMMDGQLMIEEERVVLIEGSPEFEKRWTNAIRAWATARGIVLIESRKEIIVSQHALLRFDFSNAEDEVRYSKDMVEWAKRTQI